MARIRIYKLYATGASTASNSSNVQVPQAGTVVGINWSAYGVGAASAATGVQYELATTSTSTITTNDTPGTSLSAFSLSSNIASAAFSGNKTEPSGVRLNAGDYLYLHLLAANASSLTLQCHVAVMHDK